MSELDPPAVPSLAPFSPSQAQSLAKAKLHHRLAARQGLLDLESLTADQLVEFSGDRRVRNWLRGPDFAAWLYDRDDFAPRAVALRDLAVDVLAEVLGSEIDGRTITAASKLKAAEMLFQLTDSYPKGAKRQEDPLADLDDAEVARQIAEYTAKLVKQP